MLYIIIIKSDGKVVLEEYKKQTFDMGDVCDVCCSNIGINKYKDVRALVKCKYDDIIKECNIRKYDITLVKDDEDEGYTGLDIETTLDIIRQIVNQSDC
jgi:hypothetical protein